MKGYILLQHGSSSAEAEGEQRALAGMLRNRMAGARVEMAFLRSSQPDLRSVVRGMCDSGVSEIIVAPLFLLSGSHVCDGIPKEIEGLRAEFPQVKILVTKHIGPHPKLIDIIEDRLHSVEQADPLKEYIPFENIIVVGTNHRSSPVAVRERLAVESADLDEALRRTAALDFVREAFILSTCNRTEVLMAVDGDKYADGENIRDAVENIKDMLASWPRWTKDEIQPYLYTFQGVDAVRHLFKVAAGLDSMLLGEGQILGQVRKSYKAAQRAGCIGRDLDYLLRQALKAGKRVRTETPLSSGPSLSQAAAALAAKTLGSLEGRRVLIIGAGDMASLVAEALHRAGAGSIVTANRTYDKAVRLAAKYGGSAVDLDHMEAVLAEADIVISSTGAPHPVVTGEHIERAMKCRSRRLVLLDLAVPRDIEPSAGDLEGVVLYNIDDLAGAAKTGLTEAVSRAEEIVEDETGEALKWRESRRVLPTVGSLRSRFEEVRKERLREVIAKHPELDGQVIDDLDELTRSLLNKALHGPISFLKGQWGGGNLDERRRIVREMYRLDNH